MSGNTSATGGYLRQSNISLSAQALDDAITSAVAGITGLDNGYVRPRWQPTPPNQPPAEVDWCSVGIISYVPIDYPLIQQLDGKARLTRWETLNVLASFYGPNCPTLAGQLRDGLYISQNLEQLALSGIKLTDAGEVLIGPDLVNVQWIDHADLHIRLAAAVDREYNIENIISSEGTITSDTDVTVEWNVNQ